MSGVDLVAGEEPRPPRSGWVLLLPGVQPGADPSDGVVLTAYRDVILIPPFRALRVSRDTRIDADPEQQILNIVLAKPSHCVKIGPAHCRNTGRNIQLWNYSRKRWNGGMSDILGRYQCLAGAAT